MSYQGMNNTKHHNKGKWVVYRTGRRGGKIKMFEVPTRKEARAESKYWTKFMGEKITYKKR